MKSPIYALHLMMLFSYLTYNTHGNDNLKSSINEAPMHVDFSFAFATPHRLTVSMPNSSDKTLVDVYHNRVRMKWSYENLLSKPLASFTVPAVNWEININIALDGQAFAKDSWHRAGGWLPVLEKVYKDSAVGVNLQIAGGTSAAIVRIELWNEDQRPHQVIIRCMKPGRTASNPAWVQSDWDRDVLLAGYRERADRILIFMVGGDGYPVEGPTTITQVWNLKPGDKREGWIIRPYQAYHAQLTTLRQKSWSLEFQSAQTAWQQLISQAARVRIPDSAVQNAFYAGLADCFVMREPVTDEFIAGTPGTEKYRSASPGEPSIVAILLDQVGLHTQAALGLQMCLEQQGADGNWADPKGWAHYMWGISGFKAWAVMEHYRLSDDEAYLSLVYPRMLASSRWQEQQRNKTRITENGERSLTFGLMPRGMGDCGLMDDEDLHGIFIPHNFWTIFADALTLKAARILNRTADLQELEHIYTTAVNDLLSTLERGAIKEHSYRWIPGVAGKTCGSRWGALYAAYPCGILPRRHDLINGTIKKIESYISPGGIPVNTGWMKDGLWVAIALDNLAQVQLYRDEADDAIKYLYATLNHGTPLYSWCEERGQESGSKECTGDLQHLWTPLAVSRFIRDALVMEDGSSLHLARGTARQWLGSGKSVGVEGMVTHFGHVTYELQYDKKADLVAGYIELTNGPAPEVVLHLRLPADRSIKSLSDSADGMIGNDHRTIEWRAVNKRIRFEAKLR